MSERPQETLLRMFDEAAPWPSLRLAIRGTLMPEEGVRVVTGEQWASIERLTTLTKGWLHALYDGMPGQTKPDNDADLLRNVADWLDRADDARDEFLAAHGHISDTADRSVQNELRRIALEMDR